MKGPSICLCEAHHYRLYNTLYTTKSFSQQLLRHKNVLCINLNTKRRQNYPFPPSHGGKYCWPRPLKPAGWLFFSITLLHCKKICITSAYIKAFLKIWYDFRVRMTSHVTCSRLISTVKYMSTHICMYARVSICIHTCIYVCNRSFL